MTTRDRFNSCFSVSNLRRIYTERVCLSRAAGIDGITPPAFNSQMLLQTEIASRKVLSGTYKFSSYKMKLVGKGPGKAPREISVPTIRDRIVLRALCEFLGQSFEGVVGSKLPQEMISEVKKDYFSEAFDTVVKLDVSNFYPSIRHQDLYRRLRAKVRISEIIELVDNAITTPTVFSGADPSEVNVLGVPQGLAISNILANIYLVNVDRCFNAIGGCKYSRYVDDILIFCSEADQRLIVKKVENKFSQIGLSVYDPIENPDKSVVAEKRSGFGYLGYYFYGCDVTVRRNSIEKLKNSIASIFTSYKYSKEKNPDFLLWRLNLRITGCVFKGKSKGWLFFFSEINNQSLLFELDSYVRKLVSRFSLDINPRKFSKAYKEITLNRSSTRYIPNFDTFGVSKMRSVLESFFGYGPNRLATFTEAEIEYEFKKKIDREVRELEQDISSATYSG